MQPSAFRSRKVLVLPATKKDGEISRRIFSSRGLESVICDSSENLKRELENGIGVVVAAEDALRVGRKVQVLKRAIRRQPKWSELPLVLLAKGGAGAPFSQQLVKDLGSNMLIIDRPAALSNVQNAVEASLRTRERQYDIRDHLEQRDYIEQALKEADSRKDEFLAVLAHELRNPMAAIGAAANLLSRSDLADDQRQMATGALKKRVIQMARLVDDLLDVSRIARGKIELHQEAVDLAVLVETAAEATLSFFEERKQVLKREFFEPVIIKGDPVRLEQVISNLLTNASRYTPEGGSIIIRVLREGLEAKVEVQDDGVGISEEGLANIFKLFGQSEDSLHRSKGGLGIGLTVARKLTEMHGGSVIAASEGLGKGSIFTLRFPLTNMQTTLPLNIQEKKAQPASGLSVLVIEDNRDTAIMTSALLRHAGHSVEFELDGTAGLQKALALRPDVVLLDLGLPGLNGFEVAHELRRQGLKDCLIIAISGYGQDRDLRRAQASGIDHHMLKPLEIEELNALLARHNAGKDCRRLSL